MICYNNLPEDIHKSIALLKGLFGTGYLKISATKFQLQLNFVLVSHKIRYYERVFNP